MLPQPVRSQEIFPFGSRTYARPVPATSNGEGSVPSIRDGAVFATGSSDAPFASTSRTALPPAESKRPRSILTRSGVGLSTVQMSISSLSPKPISVFAKSSVAPAPAPTTAFGSAARAASAASRSFSM